MSLDTLSIARELREADVAPAQAEAIASAIGKAVSEGAATKADLKELRLELDARFDRIDARFGQVETNIDAKLERLKNEVVRWFITSLVALAAVIIAAVKLV
jgi:hypothetical protein